MVQSCVQLDFTGWQLERERRTKLIHGADMECVCWGEVGINSDKRGGGMISGIILIVVD